VSSPAPPINRSAPRPAAKLVVATIAFQAVGEVGADQVLDAGEQVAGGMAARCRTARQRDVNASVREEVGRGVAAFAAVQLVAARAAVEHVVARAAEQTVRPSPPFQSIAPEQAFETVVAPVAAEPVAIVAAGERLDPGIDVVLCISALADARFQVGANAEIGAGERDGVEAEPAVDHVAAIARVDQVVAFPASMTSLPSPVSITSFPAMAMTMSSRPSPRIVSAPAPPIM
jgi:hypothetical protein